MFDGEIIPTLIEIGDIHALAYNILKMLHHYLGTLGQQWNQAIVQSVRHELGLELKRFSAHSPFLLGGEASFLRVVTWATDALTTTRYLWLSEQTSSPNVSAQSGPAGARLWEFKTSLARLAEYGFALLREYQRQNY